MDTYKFKSVEPPSMMQGCLAYTTYLHRDYKSAEDLVDDLILRMVEIDGRKYYVVGIKKHQTTGSYYEGALIALLVEWVH